MPAPRRKKQLVVVRHTGPELVYGPKDVEAMAAFLSTETGRKLLIAMDDAIIELVLQGHSREFALGAKYMVHFINSLGRIKDDGKEDEEQMGVIQDNTFAHPGAITGE